MILITVKEKTEGFKKIKRKDGRFNHIPTSKVFEMCDLMIFRNWQSHKGK